MGHLLYVKIFPIVLENMFLMTSNFIKLSMHTSLVITSGADIHSLVDILQRLPVVGNLRSKLPKSQQFAIYGKNNIAVSIWIVVSAVF